MAKQHQRCVDTGLPGDKPFTLAMADAAGLSRHQVAVMRRSGLIRRVLHGVYVDAVMPDSLPLRAHALALAVPEAAVITDTTAAWLYGIDIRAANAHLDPPQVSFSRLPERTRVRRPDVVGGRRTLDDTDITAIDSLLVTTPLRTACDLGRLLPRDRAIGALDALLRLGKFSREELRTEADRFRGYRWVRQLRELIPLADARAESPRESILRLRWLEVRLPEPELQIPIVNAIGTEQYRIDLGCRRVKYAAEYDGAEWHSSRKQVEHDLARRRIIQNDGWIIDVFRRDDIYGRQARVRARLRAGYHTALRRGC